MYLAILLVAGTVFDHKKLTALAATLVLAGWASQSCAAIGAFAAKAGKIDALVFTGGIGEHAA